MNLELEINKVKCIDNVKLSLPLSPGLYAITGQNGSGKSTIVACASSVILNLKQDDYFGPTGPEAYIKSEFDGKTKIWSKDGHNSWFCDVNSDLGLVGFYEGSLIYGFRFKDTSYDKLHELDKVDLTKLLPANDFIRKNMGRILQGDEEYYEKLWRTSFTYGRFTSHLFFYEKDGKKVSQFHMSTGENLLVSILNSLYIKNKAHNKKASVFYNRVKARMIFLDEIELALHPSALKRLVQFLEDMSEQFSYAVYFSTHSVELIGCIKPERIFYIERHADNSTEILNPCYPAYATRNLYNHEGYDKVILVEDDLARSIITRILKQEKLLNNRLIHVLPSGGYTHVIDFADDVVKNNLLGNKTSVCMVVDGDVKKEALAYRKSKQVSVPLGYLPIPSLEKYLLNALIKNVDHELFRFLGNYIFLQKSLKEIIDDYTKDQGSLSDEKGKLLFRYLSDELTSRRKSREDLVEIVVDYLFDKKTQQMENTINFLKQEVI